MLDGYLESPEEFVADHWYTAKLRQRGVLAIRIKFQFKRLIAPEKGGPIFVEYHDRLTSSFPWKALSFVREASEPEAPNA